MFRRAEPHEEAASLGASVRHLRSAFTSHTAAQFRSVERDASVLEFESLRSADMPC